MISNIWALSMNNDRDEIKITRKVANKCFFELANSFGKKRVSKIAFYIRLRFSCTRARHGGQPLKVDEMTIVIIKRRMFWEAKTYNVIRQYEKKK